MRGELGDNSDKCMMEKIRSWPCIITKMRAFFLHHSLHASFLQVTKNILWGDWCVLDILESFGDLDSIFSLSSTNQLNGMSHISGSYEWGVTTRWLGKVWVKFWANSANGRVVDTSRKGYLTSGLAQIQKNNDLIGLISRERFHDDGSGRRVVLWCICIMLNLIYIT